MRLLQTRRRRWNRHWRRDRPVRSRCIRRRRSTHRRIRREVNSAAICRKHCTHCSCRSYRDRTAASLASHALVSKALQATILTSFRVASLSLGELGGRQFDRHGGKRGRSPLARANRRPRLRSHMMYTRTERIIGAATVLIAAAGQANYLFFGK